MIVELALIPLLPAAAAALIGVFGRKAGFLFSASLAVLASLISFAVVIALAAASPSLASFPELTFSLGPWIGMGNLSALFGLRMDNVALLMSLLVSGAGFIIILYSAHYMHGDEDVSRFFASISLFVASMLFLVLSENLLLLFIGWEGVGLCSYLLIGHYWKESGVPLAAYRAFFVNRAGDLFFLMGVFFLFRMLGTLSFSEMPERITDVPGMEETLSIAGLLLLGGAFAKSSQIPLHVWLPDAMAGPTPVSALIHAATMVTAGVYMVTRMSWLFLLHAPGAMSVIFAASLLTIILGAILACFQTDIKKILAYSTISNLGLMFLGFAAKSPSAALMHLFGHASFKALLFLCAGAVIIYSHHEQDVRKLGGILKKLPVTRAAFWMGAIGGSAFIPYLSSGYFTKEFVLHAVQESEFSLGSLKIGGEFVYWTVIAVELLTLFYTFRLMGYLEGKSHSEEHAHGHEVKESGWIIPAVLLILTVFAPFFGVISANPAGGSSGLFYSILTGGHGETHAESGFTLESIALSVVQLLVAAFVFILFYRNSSRQKMEAFLSVPEKSFGPVARNFYFDDVYTALILKPLDYIASFSFRRFEFPVIIESLRASGSFLKTAGRKVSIRSGFFSIYVFFILMFTLLCVIVFLL